LFAIVPYAIHDTESKRHWDKFKNHTGGVIVRKKVLGVFSKTIDTYFRMPQYTFLDSNDQFWMGASFGEFGGELQIFDARQLRIADNKFDSIAPGLFFPKSIFEGNNGDIFVTSGLQHFMNSGEIFRIDTSGHASKIFKSSGYRNVDRKTGKVLDEGGFFVGPGAFNRTENCLVFATDRGIYKAGFDDTGKLDTPQLLVKPELTWSREALAIGASMAIKKMEYTADNRLLFLSKKDGIGIYNGQSTIILK